jgi:hypothetical protein
MKELTKVRMGEFMVHFDTSDSWLKFDVYPVQDFVHLPTGNEGFQYISKENEPDSIDEFDEDKCLKKLEGSYCWRGVWEGRIYFTDNEYWGEDLQELSSLYNDLIVPWCEKFIKDLNPDNIYD